jgi:hypothetical protein
MPDTTNTTAVSVISIEGDENFYNTNYQVSKRKAKSFVDNSGPSLSPDKKSVLGLFQLKSSFDNSVVQNSPVYSVSTIVTDTSGAPRKILSPNIDTFASSSTDVYKNGVEITQNKHWTAGLAKISAGTPGHLYEKSHYGMNELDHLKEKIQEEDPVYVNAYFEIDVFNPVDYLNGEYKYPIVISDSNQLENFNLNGIIEPFPIRPVISNFSINFPFEPHSTKGHFGNGNINWRGATDSVDSVFVYEPWKINSSSYFLDASDIRKISTGTENSGSVPVGPPDGFFNIDENYVSPFKDAVDPRNEPIRSNYDADLYTVVLRMTGSSIKDESYIARKEKSATNGFDCEYSDQGVDSLVYRNLTWNPSNRNNRRYRRDILNLRDSESFIKDSTSFNDTSTIFFNSGSNFMTVEYPSMLPLELTASIGIDQTTKSELFKTSGSIRVTRGVRSFVYEQPLSDSRLSAKRRLGTL